MSTASAEIDRPNGDVEILNHEPSSKTTSSKTTSSKRTGTLTFGADQFQLISALAVSGGYASVEDFCERAVLQEAERQSLEYAKRRGNAKEKG